MCLGSAAISGLGILRDGIAILKLVALYGTCIFCVLHRRGLYTPDSVDVLSENILCEVLCKL